MAVEVGVVPVIGCLADAAAPMPVHLGESPIFRAVGKVVAQVPLAEHSCRVASIRQHPSHGDLVLPQHGPAVDRVPDTCPIGPVASHQRGPRRRTSWRDVVVGKLRRYGRQGVDVGRLYDRIAGTPEIAVALIIRDHEHDIGTACGLLVGRRPGMVRHDRGGGNGEDGDECWQSFHDCVCGKG